MRQKKARSFKNTIAIIVDGEDEKWYMEKVKEYYPSSSLKGMCVKPEFPHRKKVDDLFAFAKEKVQLEYCFVLLILDMDIILKDASEFEKFKKYYNGYMSAKAGTLSPRQKSTYNWMAKLRLIINSPCLEFWYLLHYSKTTKFFADYEELKPIIRRQPNLKEYEKCETYYKNSPDIFVRLGGLDGLEIARQNAKIFSLDEAKTKGLSEMNLIFDLFDKLDAKDSVKNLV